MNFELVIVFSFSIWIAAIIALIKLSVINKSLYPFILFVWGAALNETLTYILYKNGLPNIISSNIYSLIESYLLLWFFWEQGSFKGYKWLAILLSFIYIIGWLINNFYLHKFGTQFNSDFM